ncbi:MAG: hypothetical protein ACRCV3_03790 [Desulfovibrionaceae bacterium]
MKLYSQEPNVLLGSLIRGGLEYLLLEENSSFSSECEVFEKQGDTAFLGENILSSTHTEEVVPLLRQKSINVIKGENTAEEIKIDTPEKIRKDNIFLDEREGVLECEKSNAIKGESETTIKETYSLRDKYTPERREYTEKKFWDIRFQELFDKSKKTPILWTYFALGEDIFLHPSKSRRETLQMIISSLRMKQGTHSFFPFTAPQENGVLLEYKEEFLSIVSMLVPRLIVFFGEEGVEKLTSCTAPSIMQEFIFQMPTRAIILPSINCMSTSEVYKTISYMKEYTRCLSL